jgi:hypothetical protein
MLPVVARNDPPESIRGYVRPIDTDHMHDICTDCGHVMYLHGWMRGADTYCIAWDGEHFCKCIRFLRAY